MQLWLIPILPLAGFLINGVFGRRFSKSLVNTVAIGSVLLSFLWVLKVIFEMGDLNTPHLEHYFTWIQSGTVNIGCDFLVDRLTIVMLLVVTGIGSLIHIYSIGYMAHEGGYYRFFAYMNLFMFFMLVLVLGASFLLLFVGWELSLIHISTTATALASTASSCASRDATPSISTITPSACNLPCCASTASWKKCPGAGRWKRWRRSSPRPWPMAARSA